MKLFVKNQTEDFIGDVRFEPEIVVDAGVASDDVKLVIHDYSKDAAVLKSKGSSSSILIRLIGKDAKDEKKLEGLAKYLDERMKAGMVSYQQMIMYILPSSPDKPVQSSSSSSSSSSSLICLCPVKLIQDQAAVAAIVNSFQPATSTNNSAQSKPSLASNSSSSNGVAQPYTKSAPGSSLGYNFLSSLANQMTEANKIRAESAKKSELEIREKSYRESLEKRIQSEVLKFEIDSLLMEVRLEPMNKDMRTAIHNIIEEYPNLQSASVGDFDDRAPSHVVIFRRGHLPAGVELPNVAQITKVGGVVRTSASSGGGINKAANGVRDGHSLASSDLLVGGLVEVGQVKRDRRNIEEVQEEMKRRKKEETH